VAALWGTSRNASAGSEPRCGPVPSGRPAQPAAVLQYLIRPRASLGAGLAQLQPRRVLGRRPRPVTHVMPGAWVVLIPVAPLPAAVSPGKFRTAEYAGLTGPGERYSERIVCHLPNPLRRCRLCAWPGGLSAEAAIGSGMRLHNQPTPCRTCRPPAEGVRTRAQAGLDRGSRQPTLRSEEER